MSSLRIKGTGVFLKNWKSKKRIVINRGGTRSSKTYSLCQLLVTWLITGYIREGEQITEGVASVVRKYNTNLKATVMRDFINILHNTEMYDKVLYNKTDRTFKYKKRMVEFFGADDEQKLRGHSSHILFCNEANELGYKKEFFQLLVRTKNIVFIDFNPSDPYIWINEELEEKRQYTKGDVDVIVSNYEDNGYLSKEEIAEIEYLRGTDDELWQVYGLGQYGKVTGLIYPDFKIVTEMPLALKKPGYGLDFGFTADPTALPYCGVLNANDLYLDEIIYKRGLTNPEISEEMDWQEVGRDEEIFADQAEPKSIKELKNMGWNISGAVKGADSVRYGILLLRQYNLFVTATSTNIIRELRKYKWKVDRDGNPTNTPIDKYNHALDAVRYYGVMKLSSLIRKGRGRRSGRT